MKDKKEIKEENLEKVTGGNEQQTPRITGAIYGLSNDGAIYGTEAKGTTNLDNTFFDDDCAIKDGNHLED